MGRQQMLEFLLILILLPIALPIGIGLLGVILAAITSPIWVPIWVVGSIFESCSAPRDGITEAKQLRHNQQLAKRIKRQSKKIDDSKVFRLYDHELSCAQRRRVYDEGFRILDKNAKSWSYLFWDDKPVLEEGLRAFIPEM